MLKPTLLKNIYPLWIETHSKYNINAVILQYLMKSTKKPSPGSCKRQISNAYPFFQTRCKC